MALTDADKRKVQELKKQGYSLEEVKSYFGAKKAGRVSSVERNMANQARQEKEAKATGSRLLNVLTTITGGGELARGAGLAIAAPKVLESLSQAEQEAADIDLQLIKSIGQAQKEGNQEAVNNLSIARERHLADMKNTGAVREEFINTLPSNKQVVGSAVRLAGTIATPTIAKQATAGFAAAEPVGVLASAAQGAKVGAVGGAIEGAIQGGGLAAEQDKSTAEILYGTGGGAVAGGAVGGLIGGVLGGIKGLVSSRSEAERLAKISQGEKVAPPKNDLQFAEDFASPKMTAKERAQAISQGRLNEAGVFKKASLQASKKDKEIANAIQGVIDPKNSVNQNILSLRDEVSRINNGVEDFVASNKVPFNRAQLRTQLMNGKGDLDLVFASDTNAEKIYDKVVDAMMGQLEKGDTAGLLETRKNFDSLPAVKKLLETDKLGENARKEIVLQVRRQANQFISDLLPAGNTYRADLLKEHLILEGIGNASEKLANVVDKNQIQLILNQYPVLRYVAGTLFGGTIAGAGLAAAGG